ncbi:hypothetical protein P280DRAFT_554618 [Massarina eburnea CBS 473.64]|uniref:Uncharacterized protein n=1 Tax=Massarina eburnea CBS 473.64 TaxID=1395130 RepID=A0A6A6RGN7_9PLEO|nr:hypothetical protein P280DRAFT_554618 [Massarina eburnea CBS 473.64]
MKFTLAFVSTLFAVAMAAPGAFPAAEGLIEKRCLGAGVPTTNFNDCCSGTGYADKGCACTVCF